MGTTDRISGRERLLQCFSHRQLRFAYTLPVRAAVSFAIATEAARIRERPRIHDAQTFAVR